MEREGMPRAGRGLALLLLAVIVGASESRVRDLTSEDFSAAVGRSQHVLVQFYAPWCGHCRAIAGDYEWLAELYADAEDTLIVKVDADRQKMLANAHEIAGYPTIKFFPKGASTASDVYNGDRAAQKMVSQTRLPYAQKPILVVLADLFSTLSNPFAAFPGQPASSRGAIPGCGTPAAVQLCLSLFGLTTLVIPGFVRLDRQLVCNATTACQLEESRLTRWKEREPSRGPDLEHGQVAYLNSVTGNNIMYGSSPSVSLPHLQSHFSSGARARACALSCLACNRGGTRGV